jgi:hypothetical protein
VKSDFSEGNQGFLTGPKGRFFCSLTPSKKPKFHILRGEIGLRVNGPSSGKFNSVGILRGETEVSSSEKKEKILNFSLDKGLELVTLVGEQTKRQPLNGGKNHGKKESHKKSRS